MPDMETNPEDFTPVITDLRVLTDMFMTAASLIDCRRVIDGVYAGIAVRAIDGNDIADAKGLAGRAITKARLLSQGNVTSQKYALPPLEDTYSAIIATPIPA